MKRYLAILAGLCATIFGVAAQTLQVEVPGTVGLNEQFNVTFSVDDGKPSGFEWNAGNDFSVVWGPQEGSSSMTSIVNGKMTHESKHTYTYILIAKSAGTFTLPAATVKVKNKTLTSKQISIKVVSNGAGSSGGSGSSQQGSGNAQTNAGTGDVSSSDMFLRFSVSERSVVLGEPITAVLKLYQRVNVAGFEGASFPKFNGFWSQEVETPTNIEFHREDYNDMIYNVATLRSYILIPQQTGTLTIDPAELVCLVNVRTPSRGNSIFDSFFGDDYTTIRKRLTTNAIRVDVKSLPAGAPASFGGGVGNFKVSARLSKDSLKMHEAASLLVTVSGKGNVSLLEAPKLAFPADFETYDVKTTSNTDKGGTSGSKTFEYPFIPRSHGEFDLEPVEYTYYDTASGKYVTVKSQPLHLSVAKGKSTGTTASPSVPSAPVVERDGVKDLAQDIRYITTVKPSLHEGKTFFVSKPLWWLLLSLILLAGAGIWATLRKAAAMRADVAGSRNRAASKVAVRKLKLAGDYLGKNLYTAFYEELHKALLGYVSDKLNMGMEELDKENIASRLVDAGVQQSVAEEFTSLVDACEFARYSPDGGHEAMQSHYDSSVKVITDIDSQIRKAPKSSAKLIAMLLVGSMTVFGGGMEIMAQSLQLPSAPASAASDQGILSPVSAPVVRTEPLPESVDGLWTAGVEAYSAGNWNRAVKAWEAIHDAGVESSVLFCNIGDAYYRSDNLPNAVLWYERALKADPSNSDARFNLEFVSGQTRDKIDPVPEFILKNWARSFCYITDSNTWAVLCLIFIALMVGMLLVFLLSKGTAWRRTGFYSAIAALLLALMSFLFARWQQSGFQNRDEAIVMYPVISVKSSPAAASAKDLFILHEGTKVKVTDTVGDWVNIELADGRQGWTETRGIEVI